MINQLDIYSQVILVIPSVVWRELEKQIIEKHDELLLTYRSTITNKVFPEYSIKENPQMDYPEYIKTKIKEYKDDIQQGMSEVIEIQNASNSRFRSIIDRAFVSGGKENTTISEFLINGSTSVHAAFTTPS